MVENGKVTRPALLVRLALSAGALPVWSRGNSNCWWGTRGPRDTQRHETNHGVCGTFLFSQSFFKYVLLKELIKYDCLNSVLSSIYSGFCASMF